MRRAAFVRQIRTVSLAFSLVAGGFAAWSCSSADVGSALTADACPGLALEGCGQACSDDHGCADGLFCGDGMCIADCTPGDQSCSDGETCGPRGRCISGSFDTLQTASPSPQSCGAVKVAFSPTIPTVLLLIDQSDSMTRSFNNQGTRWQVLYDALMDPTAGVVKQLEGKVRFGLTLYSYDLEVGGQCPHLTQVNNLQLGNHAAIDAVYGSAPTSMETPTGDSITAITPILAAFPAPGPKMIILATDGEPDRCEDSDQHDDVSRQEAIDAAKAAYNQGIETVIIAVGTDVSQKHQQDVANAGSGRAVQTAGGCNAAADPLNCAQTYEPQSKQALVDAFSKIINDSRTCTFTLDGAVKPGQECEGTVKLNGKALGCNDENGFRLNSPTEIELLGAACATATAFGEDKTDIDASFPCESLSELPR